MSARASLVWSRMQKHLLITELLGYYIVSSRFPQGGGRGR
jgi:hypothetical protein